MLKFLFAALLLSLPLAAQQPTYSWQVANSAGQPAKVLLSTSATTVVSRPGSWAKVGPINLRNTSGSSVTVTITDLTSNCNGAPCPLTPGAITIAANTIYLLDLKSEPATGGVQWYANTANAVVGWMAGY